MVVDGIFVVVDGILGVFFIFILKFLLVGSIYFSFLIRNNIRLIFEDVSVCKKTATEEFFKSFPLEKLRKKAIKLNAEVKRLSNDESIKLTKAELKKRKVQYYRVIPNLCETLIMRSLEYDLFDFFEIGHYFPLQKMTIKENNKEDRVINITSKGFFCLNDFFDGEPRFIRFKVFMDKFYALYNLSEKELKLKFLHKTYVHPQLFLEYLLHTNFELWVIMCLELKKKECFRFEKNFFFLISQNYIENHYFYKRMLEVNENLLNDLGIVKGNHIRRRLFGRKGAANYCILLSGNKLKIGQTMCIDTTLYAYKRSHSNQESSVFEVVIVVYHTGLWSEPVDRLHLEAAVCRRLRTQKNLE